MTWRKAGTEQGLQKVWARVAYGARYGNASLTELLDLDQEALQMFLEAVADIVRQENKSSR